MGNEFGAMAALIGDPVRANVLWLLLDGRAYTASELAAGVDTTPQNLSMHLAKMIRADLLSVEIQGRHRYYTFSRPEVAYAVESLTGLLPARPKEETVSTDPPIRYCRTCYDHLAGRVGVQLTADLLKHRILTREDSIFNITSKGIRWFANLDIDCEALQQQRRSFARTCLDWTERRPHLAGSLGAALLEHMLAEHWLRSMANTRAMLVTPKGQKAIHDLFR